MAQDVSTEEYHKFYKVVSKDYTDPLSWIHFKAEGDVEFKAVLFVPRTVPYDFYDKYYEKGAKGALKLYVRRVFITGERGGGSSPQRASASSLPPVAEGHQLS